MTSGDLISTPVTGGLSAGQVRELRAQIDRMIAGVDPPTRVRLRAISLLLRGPASGPLPCSPLSARELDVLAAVAEGMTNRAAATALGLRPNTVKAYLQSASRKLGAHNRIDAVNRARAANVL